MASWKILPALSILGLGIGFGVPIDGAETPRASLPVPPERARGAVLYRLHCASCHGAEGRGDGPVAEHFDTPPADLTRIAARRGGRFPAQEIERIVDGRIALEAHGPAEMPVWGLSLRQPGWPEDQEEEIWIQIRLLVHHLRSLQHGEVIDED